MFMAALWTELGRVKGLFPGCVWVGKVACTGAIKEPSGKQFRGFHDAAQLHCL